MHSIDVILKENCRCDNDNLLSKILENQESSFLIIPMCSSVWLCWQPKSPVFWNYHSEGWPILSHYFLVVSSYIEIVNLSGAESIFFFFYTAYSTNETQKMTEAPMFCRSSNK